MAVSCDTCVNNVYDEEYDEYDCMVNIDEDEMYRFLASGQKVCPYYRNDDEYEVVKHQI